MEEENLPEVGDLYDLDYNGLCVCVGLQHNGFNYNSIRWFDLTNSRYFEQTIGAFKKFKRNGWANKK